MIGNRLRISNRFFCCFFNAGDTGENTYSNLEQEDNNISSYRAEHLWPKITSVKLVTAVQEKKRRQTSHFMAVTLVHSPRKLMGPFLLRRFGRFCYWNNLRLNNQPAGI